MIRGYQWTQKGYQRPVATKRRFELDITNGLVVAATGLTKGVMSDGQEPIAVGDDGPVDESPWRRYDEADVRCR